MIKSSRAAVALGAVLTLAALSGCADGAKTAGAKSRATPADTIALGASDVFIVETIDLSVGVPVSGTLAPRHDIVITSPLKGELLDAVLVREGQSVRKGQVLARFRTAVVSPAAASASSSFQIAKADYQRMKNLFDKGAASQSDVEAAEAKMRAAEANAASTGKTLDDASVEAPFAGTVARRDVDAGNRLGEGDPMFRLVNTSELEFQATIPAAYASRVKVGTPVTLAVTGLPGVEIQGRLDRVNAVADAATRQVRVYVVVPNHDHRLSGDLFASGNVLLEQARNVLAVPQAAIRQDPTGASFTWVATGGRIARRDVRTGLVDERADRVEVLDGLDAGDLVVIGPIEGLAQGQPVMLPERGH